MNKKILFSILGVLSIIVVTTGVTYAYINASGSVGFSTSTKEGLNTSLNLTTVTSASTLVPLQDSKIKTAISKASNKCIDKNNYTVCSLYTISLSNSKTSESIYGYVKTINSTYTTNNLKYQIYDSSYNAVTDVMTISKTANEYVYFKKGTSQVTITSTGSKTYYLVVWLSDTNSEQSSDYSKTFKGAIGIELVGVSSGRLEATF